MGKGNRNKYFTVVRRKMREEEEMAALPMETRPQPDNHLIGIDSTIHTYAPLIRGNQCWAAQKPPRVTDRDTAAMMRSRRPRRPCRNCLLLLSAVLNCVFRLERRKCVSFNV